MFSDRDTIPSIYKAALNPDCWNVVFREIASGTGTSNIRLKNISRKLTKNAVHRSVIFNLSNGAVQFHEREADTGSNKFLGCLERISDSFAYSIEIDDRNDSAHRVMQDRLHSVATHLDFAVESNLTLLSHNLSHSWLRAVLNDWPEPAFVLDLDGTVLWRNQIAPTWSRHTIAAADEARQLSFAQPTAQAEFKSCLKEFSSGSGSGIQCFRVDLANWERHGVFVMKAVEPSYALDTAWYKLFRAGASIVAVLRCGVTKPAVVPATLNKLYNLTSKEIEVATALAQGEGLGEYAKRAGLNPETVRWHAKKVLHKMECKKQQDVVQTLLYQNALLPIIP